MKPPEFYMQVLPEEVKRHGPAAAIVLAHIRFRCNGPGCIEREGFRWWRVSRQDMGREVGLSLKVVRKAIDQLSEVVVAKHFAPLSNQSLAYRPVDDDGALTCQKPERADADQAEAREGTSGAPEGISRSPTGLGTEPHRASALPTEELKEEMHEGGVREPDPLDVEIVPGPANAHPRQSEPGSYLDKPADGPVFDAEIVDDDTDPEPPRFCDRHPNDTPDPCGPCIGRRRAHDRWLLRHPVPPPKSKLRAWWELTEKLRAEEERAEDACAAEPEPELPAAVEAKAAPKPRPTPPPWVPGPDGIPRCRRHAHLPHPHPSCTACRDLREAS